MKIVKELAKYVKGYWGQMIGALSSTRLRLAKKAALSM